MNVDSSNRSYPDSIRTSLSTRWLGQPLHYFPAVSSTNDLLVDMANSGAPAGALVVTDYQREGKGRLGRRWLAPACTSLLFSLLFRPSWPPEHANWLTMIAGLAAIESINSLTGLDPGLKWPNDLVVADDAGWRKLGGLLLEGQFTDGRLSAAILGIGINVNVSSDELPQTQPPATSLLRESGNVVRRSALLSRLLGILESRYERAERGLSPHADWERNLVTLGRRVTATQAGNHTQIIGTAGGTDEWGRLLVRDDDGRQHAFSAADVTLQVDNSGD